MLLAVVSQLVSQGTQQILNCNALRVLHFSALLMTVAIIIL